MKREKMKKLSLARWAVFKKDAFGGFMVINTSTNKPKFITREEIRFLRLMDGKTDPFEIDSILSADMREDLIERMYYHGILREKRFAEKSFFSCLLTLWEPENTVDLRVNAYIINKVLCFVWLPVLMLGALCFSRTVILEDFRYGAFIAGNILGILAGIFLHEMGHMFACLAYKGKVYEVGIMTMFYLLPGAYVIIATSNIKSRIQRIQINAAGIEMNFLLSGIGMFFCGISDTVTNFALGFIITNMFLALLNLVFVRGFDGMTIMNELLGVEDVAGKAADIVSCRADRKFLVRRHGINGRATIFLCFIIRLFQLALPSVIILNIIEVIGWFH